jgi:hypothetical protein
MSGRRGFAVAAACIAALVVTAVPASALVRVPRGVQMRTDGTLTVGQQETLSVKRIPRRPKVRLTAKISPSFTTPGCKEGFAFELSCVPEPLFAVPGSPPFRARKGRASLTFVMPSAYEFFNLKDPLLSHPVTLVNGQSIDVVVDGFWHQGGSTNLADLASSTAVVEVPPAP